MGKAEHGTPWTKLCSRRADTGSLLCKGHKKDELDLYGRRSWYARPTGRGRAGRPVDHAGHGGGGAREQKSAARVKSSEELRNEAAGGGGGRASRARSLRAGGGGGRASARFPYSPECTGTWTYWQTHVESGRKDLCESSHDVINVHSEDELRRKLEHWTKTQMPGGPHHWHYSMV